MTKEKEAPIEVDEAKLALGKKLFEGKLSSRNILIAYASDTDEALLSLIALADDSSEQAQLKRNTLKIEIHSKINAIFSQMNSVTAELDCEEERIDQIATTLSNINDKSVTRLTVASILVGAASAVAGAYITDDNWNKGVTVGSGVLGAGLSFLTLNPKGKKVVLQHPRNLLRCFITEKNDIEFPPFVWYMLNEPRFTNSGESSVLQNTQKRWIRHLFDNDKEKALKAVVFSDGGVYNAGDLHTRAEMFDQMQ
ncbi:hypothetical protein, partial [Capnocytophaga gingivalis]